LIYSFKKCPKYKVSIRLMAASYLNYVGCQIG
jgi:hypothetical protein